jgi:tRNA dimethylallyltransferase
VGGTGLYLRILLHGLVQAPGAEQAVRARLSEEGATPAGRRALYERLALVDPPTAKLLSENDVFRITRALEIFEVSGRTASQWRAEHRFAGDRYPHQLIVLAPPREELYDAINKRTRSLYEAGLVEEARELARKGFRATTPMGSVGYRQALDVVDGKISVEQAARLTARETRNYAKRQLTWFRKERGAHFISPPYEEAVRPG